MPKHRLTITLDKSIVKKLDELIQEKKVPNRSHGIEMILQKSLRPKIKTAVILAGDKNQQYKNSRALTLINQEPLILYTLKHLQKFGISKVFILTNHQGQALQQTLKDHHLDLKISWFFEDKPLGTAGALKQLQDKITDTFLCLHGDIFTDINLKQFAKFHTGHKALVTIAVKPRIPQDSFDNVYIQGHQVVGFKPKKKGQLVSIVNSGIYLFEPELLIKIPAKKPLTLEKNIFPQLIKANSICAYPFQGLWFDVSSDKNFKKAAKQLKSSNTT